MTGKSGLYALAVAVLMGTMAVAALAGDQGMHQGMHLYGPADSSVSNDVGTSESQADAWDLREAMETGALPDQQVGSSDAMCCRGIDEPTVESGGLQYRPDIDVGP